jgi:DNA-binding NarL/FixJ family response regulator
MRIVLVDDHALFRDGVASLLLAWGHEVVGQASDGGEAVELVDQTSPDVVLMDVRMANVGGIEATARIKERHPEVAIVMLTVSEDEADLFRAIKAGAQGYLLKNLEAPQLRSMLEGVARGEPAITPATAAWILDEFVRTPARYPQASRLTYHELEVLPLVTGGLRNREIGTELGITENTVKFHLKNIVGKLHAQNRADLAARAVREGLVPYPPRDIVSHERPHRNSPPRHDRPSP